MLLGRPVFAAGGAERAGEGARRTSPQRHGLWTRHDEALADGARMRRGQDEAVDEIVDIDRVAQTFAAIGQDHRAVDQVFGRRVGPRLRERAVDDGRLHDRLPASLRSRAALSTRSSMSSLTAHVHPVAVAVARLLADGAVRERLVDREGADIDEALHLVLGAGVDDVLQARHVLRHASACHGRSGRRSPRPRSPCPSASALARSAGTISGPMRRDARRMAEIAHHAAHLDALLQENLGEPAADEAGGAGDQHLAAGRASVGRGPQAPLSCRQRQIGPRRLERLARLVAALDQVDRLDAVARRRRRRWVPPLTLVLKSRQLGIEQLGEELRLHVRAAMPSCEKASAFGEPASTSFL